MLKLGVSQLLTRGIGLFSPASPGKAVLEYNIAEEVHKALSDTEKE